MSLRRISANGAVRKKAIAAMGVKALMNRKQIISFNWTPREGIDVLNVVVLWNIEGPKDARSSI